MFFFFALFKASIVSEWAEIKSELEKCFSEILKSDLTYSSPFINSNPPIFKTFVNDRKLKLKVWAKTEYIW